MEELINKFFWICFQVIHITIKIIHVLNIEIICIEMFEICLNIAVKYICNMHCCCQIIFGLCYGSIFLFYRVVCVNQTFCPGLLQQAKEELNKALHYCLLVKCIKKLNIKIISTKVLKYGIIYPLNKYLTCTYYIGCTVKKNMKNKNMPQH